MSSFGLRLQQLIEHSGLSQLEFSNNLDIKPANLSRYVNNKSNPGILFINKLLFLYPTLNANWLLNGSGNMFDKSLKFDQTTLSVIEMVYPIFNEHNKLEDFYNILLNAALEESLNATLDGMDKEKIFWSKWITSNRYEIVFLILLEKVLKLATKNKSVINVSERTAKNTLIKIFKDYTISLSDKMQHFITNNEKKIVISHLEDNLTDADAFKILQNMPIVLEKISEHLKIRRKLVIK